MTAGPDDPAALAQEFVAAYASGRPIAAPPSARHASFDLATAYRVESEIARLRKADGHAIAGRKVGFANKALWRVFKLDTLVWAHMYDDTVQHANKNEATCSIARLFAPKIEPEIVFKMKSPLPTDRVLDAAEALGRVEWLALGFEIIDSPFAEGKFQPADFVAAFGLHAALVVGEPLTIEPTAIPALVDQLQGFTVTLSKDGAFVEKGSGKNALRSPALCLAELASALTRQQAAEPLAAGELVSTGTLTESRPVTAGETWTAVIDGLPLPALSCRF